MHISYWAYHVRDSGGIRRKIDLRGFLSAFCGYGDNAFKRRFYYDDNHVFLVREYADLLMFLMTRDGEIIRKIDTSSLEVNDISDMLNDSESLGFASYVLFREDHFAFGSTLMAPKVPALAHFVNELFSAVGCGDFKFFAEPLLMHTTIPEALALPFVGRTHVQVRMENPAYRDFLRTIGFTDENNLPVDLDEIEIILRPKRNRSIRAIATRLINRANGEGLEKMVIRGKREESDRMADFFIAGAGQIGDDVPSCGSQRLHQSIVFRMQENRALSEALGAWREDEPLENLVHSRLNVLGDADIWSDPVSGVRVVDE